MDKIKVEITLKQFEILNDVLDEIEENREYEGEDGVALRELQEMFNYSRYMELRDK